MKTVKMIECDLDIEVIIRFQILSNQLEIQSCRVILRRKCIEMTGLMHAFYFLLARRPQGKSLDCLRVHIIYMLELCPAARAPPFLLISLERPQGFLVFHCPLAGSDLLV